MGSLPPQSVTDAAAFRYAQSSLLQPQLPLFSPCHCCLQGLWLCPQERSLQRFLTAHGWAGCHGHGCSPLPASLLKVREGLQTTLGQARNTCPRMKFVMENLPATKVAGLSAHNTKLKGHVSYGGGRAHSNHRQLTRDLIEDHKANARFVLMYSLS